MTDVQLAPRSIVLRRARHVPVGHPTTPKTKAADAETKLADWTTNPDTLIGRVVGVGPVVGGDVVSETEGAWIVVSATRGTATKPSPRIGKPLRCGLTTPRRTPISARS